MVTMASEVSRHASSATINDNDIVKAASNNTAATNNRSKAKALMSFPRELRQKTLLGAHRRYERFSCAYEKMKFKQWVAKVRRVCQPPTSFLSLPREIRQAIMYQSAPPLSFVTSI